MNIFVFLMLVGLLSSLLLTTATTTVTNNNQVLGQDEEEEKDKDEEKEQEEQEEEEQENSKDSSSSSEESEDENNSKGSDDFEIVQEEEQQNFTTEALIEEQTEEDETKNTSIIAEPLQQISDGWNDISETKQQLEQQKQQVLTEEQAFKEDLKSILIGINMDEPVTTTTTPVTTTSELSCNCTPIEGADEPIKPIVNLAGDHILNPAQPVNDNLQQIIIDPSDIINYKSIGSVENADYVNTYNAKNVLDNKIDENSFWSQYNRSGFLIQLKPEALQDWQVCSAEVNAYKANNVPFTLAVQAGQNYTGVLDNTVENVNFDTCVENVNKIMMYFDSVDKYTSIGELKLFGKPVNANPLPTEPPVLEPDTDSKIIQIKNSNAEISIDNSTVVLKFGSNTYKIDPDSKIVLIPNKGANN